MHGKTKSTGNDFPDLGLLKDGDNEAWDIAFSHLWPIALWAARHSEACLADSDIEDAASGAIHELITKIETVKDVDHAKALLTIIARNHAVSIARKNSAKKRRLPDNCEPPFAEPHSVFSNDLMDIERCEMILSLRQALNGLTSQTQLLLMEKIAYGRTSEEISKKYGLPLGTVCTNVARGLKKVREQLQQSPLLMKELREYLR